MSGRVDNYALGANMYGCMPCPKCGSKYRAAYRKTITVDCDDCGFKELAVFADDEKHEGCSNCGVHSLVDCICGDP